MKKLLFFILLAIFLISPINILAYQQTEAVCYSQCAAHKFYWKGDFCWDLFTNQCSVGSNDMVKDAIKLVKDTTYAMATGKLKTIVDVSEVFKAMFVCKPLIEDCIVPQLQACENTCKNVSQTYYAPNLSVGNPYGSIAYQNVYYDDARHQLTFKVINNGGYAWDIDVSASWGHTRNRDKMVSGGGTLFTEKIPEMIFFGARVGSPKTPGDYVTDFLIEESNFAGFLAGFKSDADNHYIPPAWYKTIPFTAPEGEFTKVILNVDPNQMIPEASEGDNTYILEIDKLPTPFSFTVENMTYERMNARSLSEYMVSFRLKNSGEENGNAKVKLYEGKYDSGKNPIYEKDMTVLGLSSVNFDHIINVDVADGGDSSNFSQKYTIVVFDDEGFIKTQHEFSIPKFAGSISGRTEDLFGKKVIGAKITTTSGQETTTNDMGYYHIRGIPVLEVITVKAVHPDFSKEETREVEIKFDDSKDKCHPEGLTHTGVDFVLKDKDVLFNITITDTAGNPVTAGVLASNADWQFSETVNGNGPLPGMQPGKYNFTISAAGYKTISQDVSAVPNDLILEFKLEKLNGRLTDGGLSIHEPQLLWQMDRGEEILSQVTAAKDGKLVILYTTRNKANTGKLYFLEAQTGNRTKVISGVTATTGQSQACLDTSYDGNTTALLVHDGTFGMAQETRNVLKLFNNQGSEFGMKDFKSGGGANNCDVSPDGFYVYPERLMNKGLYVYTRHEIFGIKNSKEDARYTANDYLHFTTANNLVAGCPKGGGQCVQNIYKSMVTDLGKLSGSIKDADSSQDGKRVGITTVKKIHFLDNGTLLWEKDLKTYGEPADVSVSPGGKYVIYSTASESEPYRSIKIYTDNDIAKTPAGSQKGKTEDVVFVQANDKGIFYLAQNGKTLKFYQVGSYGTDYNSQTQASPTPENATSGLSYFENGGFYPAGVSGFGDLIEGLIYMANRSINLDIGGTYGTLHITNGTIFSVDHDRHPVLLKGQLTADFNSPMTVYAIKFDRYDMNLFKRKLGQFIWSKTLPESEYYIVKNIHTRFTLKNNPNEFEVLVDKGQVNVTIDKTEKLITTGKQITIDGSNNFKESAYLDVKVYAIITGVLALVVGILLHVYRKTKIGGKIIEILKIVAILIVKAAIGLVNLLVKLFQKKLIRGAKR
ncbi:MAG: carboxypeptidase-like regulatory domain-containing protein [Candidatus Shapirobacteria bacterium]|jgi:hypothetical protein